MHVKIVVNKDIFGVFDCDTCSEYEQKLIKTYIRESKINKRFKVLKATEEEYNDWIKTWKEVLEYPWEDCDG